MKRQRSRNRNSGGGKPQQHNANRAFESNGPDGVKIRGAAQHVYEKYQQLARDAVTSGDRVLAENYQQHAEHYFRLLRTMQPHRPASDIIGRDAFASGYDIDFEDEGQAAGEAEAAGESGEAEGERGEWRQDQRPREDRFRDNQPRDRNFNRDDRPRDDRPREERFRDDRPRGDRGERFRQDRPRDDRGRDDRPRDDRPREEHARFDQPERRSEDPLAVVEPQATPLTRETDRSSSPLLRSEDGGVSHAPAFLQAREPRGEFGAEEEEARPRSRRRRAPRNLETAADHEAPAGADEEA